MKQTVYFGMILQKLLKYIVEIIPKRTIHLGLLKTFLNLWGCSFQSLLIARWKSRGLFLAPLWLDSTGSRHRNVIHLCWRDGIHYKPLRTSSALAKKPRTKKVNRYLVKTIWTQNNDEDFFSRGFWLACIFPGLSRALRIFEVWKCNKKPAKVQIGRMWMAWAYSWGSKISRDQGRECSLQQQPASGCRGRKSHGCLHRGDATLQAQTIFRSALAEAWRDIGS